MSFRLLGLDLLISLTRSNPFPAPQYSICRRLPGICFRKAYFTVVSFQVPIFFSLSSLLSPRNDGYFVVTVQLRSSSIITPCRLVVSSVCLDNVRQTILCLDELIISAHDMCTHTIMYKCRVHVKTCMHVSMCGNVTPLFIDAIPVCSWDWHGKICFLARRTLRITPHIAAPASDAQNPFCPPNGARLISSQRGRPSLPRPHRSQVMWNSSSSTYFGSAAIQWPTPHDLHS